MAVTGEPMGNPFPTRLIVGGSIRRREVDIKLVLYDLDAGRFLILLYTTLLGLIAKSPKNLSRDLFSIRTDNDLRR